MPDYLARVLGPPGLPGAADAALSGTTTVRVSAPSADAVAAVLGLHPAQVLSVRALHGAAAAGLGRTARAPALDLRLFSQELALLLQSGITLLESLQTLRERDQGRPGAAPGVLDTVIDALQQGLPVSAALAQVPQVFDPLFIAMVAAGERTGQLASTLAHHADYLTWSGALASRLKAALVYPLMLLGAGGAVVMFLLLYVLPRFAGVFDGLGQELPAASRALIALGVAAAAHPVAALALAASGPALALLAWRWPRLRTAVAAWAWRWPALGPRLRTVALARLYRGLGLLLGAGVPVLPGLRLLDGVLAAPLRPALAAVAAAVGQGQRLSQALQQAGLATPVALRMVRVGERGGALAPMLERAARFHDDEIARLSELVTRTVNPVLMLVMGVVIGGIVVLMYLPIFTLMEQVQ
jgi:general secretion pathway protein F